MTKELIEKDKNYITAIHNIRNRIIKNTDIMESKTADGSYSVPFDNRFVVLHIIEDELNKAIRDEYLVNSEHLDK